MYYMVMLVLDNPDLLDKVLESWHQNGIGGATIIESSGFHRWQAQKRLLPMRYNLPPLKGELGNYNYTLFTVVPSEEKARQALQAVEEITGNLDDPNTGSFAAWPIELVTGVPAQPKA